MSQLYCLRMSRFLGTHLGSAFIALVTAGVVLGGGNLLALLTPVEEPEIAVLTLAYTKPLSLSVSVGARNGGGVVDIAQEHGTETVHITLPADWERSEVSGAALEEATSSPLSAHWTSWKVPTESRLRFLVPRLPDHAELSLPSGVPLSLTITKADLSQGTSIRSERLLQENRVTLW